MCFIPLISNPSLLQRFNKYDWTCRGQAGQLEAAVLPQASGSSARAGPWVTPLSADGWGQGFCTSACHLVGTRKREALDMELCTN